jgi:hypothetical protein
MNWKISLLLILIGFKGFAQELPTNPETGLVFIKDSIEIKNKSLQEVKDIMSKWAHTLMDVENLKRIYDLNNSRQTETIGLNFPLESFLTQDKGNNKFLTNGALTYSKLKTNGLNAYAPTATGGSIKFSFSYTISSNKLIFEFTNLECSNGGAHYGKFEDVKPPQDDRRGYGSLLFSHMGKKEWKDIRAEYFDRLKILADNLKEYATTVLKSNQLSVKQSPINYESYKQIKTGMAYDEVVKLLVDEGKELSNTSTQLNGKAVTQQTIVWNDLDKTKSITITFADGKVLSKAQTNL